MFPVASQWPLKVYCDLPAALPLTAWITSAVLPTTSRAPNTSPFPNSFLFYLGGAFTISWVYYPFPCLAQCLAHSRSLSFNKHPGRTSPQCTVSTERLQASVQNLLTINGHLALNVKVRTTVTNPQL